jgi:hypothetical protein
MRVILTVSALALSLALVGCNNAEVAVQEKRESTNLLMENKQTQREIILRDSIYDPLPEGIQEVQAFPDKGGPQLLPNVDVNTPIIISKMPYRDLKKLPVEETEADDAAKAAEGIAKNE